MPLININTALSPHGFILILPDHSKSFSDSELVDQETGRRILAAFNKGIASGILHLASKELSSELPAILSFWRDVGRHFLTELCRLPDLEEQRYNLQLSIQEETANSILSRVPPMRGGEYLSLELLRIIWASLTFEIGYRLKAYRQDVDSFLQELSPSWNLVGRLCFHLAENKENLERPFGFIVTYTHQLSPKAKAQHIPLGKALQHYSGSENKNSLLSLLKPLQKAARQSQFLKELLDAGDIYHPLAWSPEQAYTFLKEIPLYESAGVLVRVPDWWHVKRPPRPEIKMTIGSKEPSGLGLAAMLNFDLKLTLDDKKLSESDLLELMAENSGLVSFKGQWVELDRDKLSEVLTHWRFVQKNMRSEGLSFAEGMRLIAGASPLSQNKALTAPLLRETPDWCQVAPGKWFAKTLEALRLPPESFDHHLDSLLKGTLRPYQRSGVHWLFQLYQLKLGACLADDMGLGKTIQILALLLLIKQQKQERSTLLIVPASLIANWLAEAQKFAPSLTMFVLHPSAFSSSKNNAELGREIHSADVTVTTYSMLLRHKMLQDMEFGLVILDEAQAIKNPTAKQTIAAKNLKAKHRIALTGTPVENHLGDLWSLFDFINPGLLGGAEAFNRFTKSKDHQDLSYAAIRKLIQPYIMRRLKTDKSIIQDLPEKTEVTAYCSLSKVQAALYQQAVNELSLKIKEVDGIQRRGIILGFLLRFKQICNHPSQWLEDGVFDSQTSGKFIRLGEICEEIMQRQEKILIFTQFRSMTGPIAAFLARIFKREGLVLHGATPVKERKKLVDSFQQEAGPPFFVLSLKAGGTGLNLTAASHVLHFDRWWNPAIENQATDRAFRIGQKNNVLVHKFVCQGTIEDKIHVMIESKKSLATQLLQSSGEAVITEMSNEELINMVTLDINSAMSDAE